MNSVVMRFNTPFHRGAGLVLALLICTAGCDRRTSPASMETYALDFLGESYEWTGHPPRRARTADSWAALFQNTFDDDAGFGTALAHIAGDFSPDSYTRLMVLRDFAAGVPLIEDSGPIGYHEAMAHGWDPVARAVFMSAVLHRQGYAAVPLESGGRGLIGLAVNDPGLNSHRVTYTVERPLFFSKQELRLTFMVWDPDSRIGSPQLGADDVTLLLDPGDLFRIAEGRRFDFRDRTIPSVLYENRERRTFDLAGAGRIHYQVYPHVAAWLKAYPEFHFTAQLALEQPESHHIQLAATLDDTDERAWITALLQGVQQHFDYVEGPLRSIHEILAARQGDCDQLALVLALMLLEAGYEPADLVAIVWEDADHMGLGIRPRTATGAPLEGMRFTIDGSPYYVLDPTFYHWRDGELVSAWGQMNPENHQREPTIEFLESLP